MCVTLKARCHREYMAPNLTVNTVYDFRIEWGPRKHETSEDMWPLKGRLSRSTDRKRAQGCRKHGASRELQQVWEHCSLGHWVAREHGAYESAESLIGVGPESRDPIEDS